MRAEDGAPPGQAAAGVAAANCGDRWIDVCASDALLEGGDGVRFDWPGSRDGEPPAAAFVVRHEGCARAFLNRCAHVAAELDWLPGRFFDDAGLYLVCSMHGALYEPDSGLCVAGPCTGARLASLRCEERDGRVRVAIGRLSDR